MYFYSSASPDAPKLTNTYGNFNDIINYIIDGGSLYNIVKIEPNTDKTVKIYYDSTLTDCPWVEYQTIIVSNSTSSYNKEYFIEGINITDKYLIGYNSSIVFNTSAVELSTDTNIIKAKVRHSGITRVFGGKEGQRTVIKFDDSVQFRIDDRDFGPLLNPPITTNNSWNKTARVSMAETYDTLDYTAGRIWPYNYARPNENFLPHGNFIGQSHIFYNNIGGSTNNLTDTTNVGSNNQYKIWASNKCMYIQIYTSTAITSSVSRFYIIGNFDALDKTKKNGLIFSSRLNGENPYTQTGSYMRSSQINEAPSFLHTRLSSTSNLVIFNNTLDKEAECNIIGSFGLGSAAPSGAGMARPNLPDGGTYISDAILCTLSPDYMGKLYDVKWINCFFAENQGSVIAFGDDLYMIVLSNGAYSLIKLDKP